ncbi:MAG TPA: peroxide stress protein YaaA, partial [Candidatus Thioglobus sp.]|nr:peroxide stress protein YaaA [Candidatus Thioglobus sp.]
MLAIISPSKTQDFSACDCEAFSQTRQIENSKELVAILKDKNEVQIAKLMSLSEKLAKLNFDRFQNFQAPFT